MLNRAKFEFRYPYNEIGMNEIKKPNLYQMWRVKSRLKMPIHKNQDEWKVAAQISRAIFFFLSPLISKHGITLYTYFFINKLGVNDNKAPQHTKKIPIKIWIPLIPPIDKISSLKFSYISNKFSYSRKIFHNRISYTSH